MGSRYTVAMGVSGEPTTRVSLSGGAINKNRERVQLPGSPTKRGAVQFLDTPESFPGWNGAL